MTLIVARRTRLFLALPLAWTTLSLLSTVAAQEPTSPTCHTETFEQDIRPLLDRYCIECHSGDEAEADVDFSSRITTPEILAQPELWLKVREALAAEQMPPADATQLAAEERSRLAGWIRDWLKKEAESRSGDPGPVALRRLSNAEYTCTIRELTGVESLDPAREFPVDGASGEGFTNSGAGQGMSAALLTKYLDAAREIAGHAVLLPDGIAFSRFGTRRDHSDEWVAKIQTFYNQYSDEGGGTTVDLQGIRFDTNQGGLLPLAKYLRATLEFREDLLKQKTTTRQVALDQKLSPKYLDQLWRALTDESPEANALYLAAVRAEWKSATGDDVSVLADKIHRMQATLWRFNPVGQIGRVGGPTAWMEPVSPFVFSQELTLPLPVHPQDAVVVCLTAKAFGDEDSREIVEWQQPRLEYADGRSPILLRDIDSIATRAETAIATDGRLTSRYLAAAAALRSGTDSIEAVAMARQLNPQRLAAWMNYLDFGRADREVHGLLSERRSRVNGLESINGWGSAATPSILTNRSGDTVAFSTLLLPPRSVFVHPSPELDSVVVWQSPIAGSVRLAGRVADADNNCGNGIQWTLQCQNESGLTIIDQGVIDNAGQKDFTPDHDIDIRTGDLISLVVDARDQSHVCDTTCVDLTIQEIGGEGRVWSLANDVVDRVEEGNPLADTMGNPRVWHFCAQAAVGDSSSSLPDGSALALWKKALLASRPDQEPGRLAAAVQDLLTAPTDAGLQQPDRELRNQLLAWQGPLRWLDGLETQTIEAQNRYGLKAERFGVSPDGAASESASLCLPVPQVLEIRLPGQLASGATFVTKGLLHSRTADRAVPAGGAIQLQLLPSRPEQLSIDWEAPFLVGDDVSRRQLEAAAQRFRETFPAALCYSRIVPVDEVVTLNLYYREDAFLKQLMLNDGEIAELDRLWDQLYFVSREPVSLTTVFEQISEFATQDRPDLVEAFAPMRKHILERADRFQARLVEVEPLHVQAVLQFADRAWRRPLREDESQNLEKLYRDLRDEELPHEEAIRLILARVLTAPSFLYKREAAGPGREATSISSHELATRLSYFLWSSPPDQELRTIADAGQLVAAGEWRGESAATPDDGDGRALLLQQTRRMLKDPRARRLAIQFACQWLHVRDFDQNNDKNEKLFPEFSTLRRDMYEETVLFFEDMIRHNGSILDLVDGDHSFVNESLARHYGIDNIAGVAWQRVEGMQGRGRGGVLGMATILASQSGASRTSPILRGNWVSETLLGERLPRPPANVPQLPESVPAGLTARQLIELHSHQPECARCHVRIDPYGFALEQFDPLGRMRPAAMDTQAELMDGTPIDGLAGLNHYLATTRRHDVVRQFCRKLLGYALGREVLFSDESLLDDMQVRLEADDYRFATAVETIVSSPQFLKIRGRLFDPSAE